MLKCRKIHIQWIARFALVFGLFALGAAKDIHAADTVAAKPPTPAVVMDRDFFASTFNAHLLLERYIPAGAMLFFGDSHVMHLELDSLHPYPVNFGIPGDTTEGLKHRLRKYKSIKTASAVLLEGGVNDLGFGSQFDNGLVKNYVDILKRLPKTLDIYILGIFPVNEIIEPTFAGYNDRIRKINRRLASLCNKTHNCVFINVNAKLMGKDGQILPQYLRPKDGTHLNKAGKRIVLEGIRQKLKNYQAPAQTLPAPEQINTSSLPAATE